MDAPTLSLIVPSRGRPQPLRRLLDSLATTTAQRHLLEVVVVSDADDPGTGAVEDARLHLRHVVVPPGQTMGALNTAGYEAARGRYLMLLNDDVVARTPGWDGEIRRCCAAYPDDIALVHVNDLVMQRHLCIFPVVSRTFCRLVGGICPTEYRRYRIDDHIEDLFNLLGVLGERRIVYAPEVVFEHLNYRTNDAGLRQYFSDPAMLAQDAPCFDRLLSQRKEQALRLMAHIKGGTMRPWWRRKVARVADSLTLRTAGRQRILTPGGIVEPWLFEPRPSAWSRVAKRLRTGGLSGFVRALADRVSHDALHSR